MVYPLLSKTVNGVVNLLLFNADGLVPAITQQYDTGEVLMMAWMNKDALEKTLSSKYMFYYSRSRSKLWKKGESSGHVQIIKEILD